MRAPFLILLLLQALPLVVCESDPERDKLMLNILYIVLGVFGICALINFIGVMYDK
tara:strand:- start:187 stop:354 length:168 start_codon:yes stop_codon:yes gene_type:complete